MKEITIILTFLFSAWFKNDGASPNEAAHLLQYDSIEKTICDQDINLPEPESALPPLQIITEDGGSCKIKLFKSSALNMEIRHIRPKRETGNFLCVPAAYTDKEMKIDGLFYEKGEVIRPIVNQKLTGACIVKNSGIEIIELSKVVESTLKQLKDNKWSIFQQCLLVKDKKNFPCLHFGERKNVRRALIQFDNYYCVGETDKRVTIKEFSQALINIGATYAVNLDMGSWSEGWYQNEAGMFITNGEKDNMGSTKLQSNWLLLRRGD